MLKKGHNDHDVVMYELSNSSALSVRHRVDTSVQNEDSRRSYVKFNQVFEYFCIYVFCAVNTSVTRFITFLKVGLTKMAFFLNIKIYQYFEVFK